MPTSPFPELVAGLAAGRMVILVDDEDRENEGDLVLAADHVTPAAINFMARFARGLICLTLTRERCGTLHLAPMAARNGTKHGTAFTVSIEAATGVTTGISAADRARCRWRWRATPASDLDAARPCSRSRPGRRRAHARRPHRSRLRPRRHGRPGAGRRDLRDHEGRRHDGALPDLEVFAREHGLKIGTIADLIGYRSRHENAGRARGRAAWSRRRRVRRTAWRDQGGGLHLALTHGRWTTDDEVPVRVHEPFTVFDMLDTGAGGPFLPLPLALAALRRRPCGVAVLLNCSHDRRPAAAAAPGRPRRRRTARQIDRTYGIGAQILRDLGVRRMKLLGSPRRMPSMVGYGLEGHWLRRGPA